MVQDSEYRHILDMARTMLDKDMADAGTAYSKVFNHMIFSRMKLLKDILLRKLPDITIQSGPFKGMKFYDYVAEGCYMPKLLGCYEEELHPVILACPEKNYDTIIDIGCAEGYYAVGLARLCPSARVLAFDTNKKAQETCGKLAQMNGVSDRVTTYGTFGEDSFGNHITDRTLVFCDCEGGEYTLLDPEKHPQLKNADLIVELHDTIKHPEYISLIRDRFAATHNIDIIQPGARNPQKHPLLVSFGHLDQWLCVWEYRGFNTPWAVMTSRHAA